MVVVDVLCRLLSYPGLNNSSNEHFDLQVKAWPSIERARETL